MSISMPATGCIEEMVRAQRDGGLQHLGRQDALFLACAGLKDVEGRVDAAVGEPAIEHELHVARALEFLKDVVVHARAGVDEGGGQDGERAAFLEDAGVAEEATRHFHGAAVHAARQRSAAVPHALVVGPGQTRDAVEQHEHLLAPLREAFGSFHDELGRAHVAGRVAVGTAGHHFAANRPAHLRDLFGPLVDEQHDEVHLRMIRGDGLGDVVQEDGLAGARRRHDQAPLPLADRRQQVHDPRRHRLLARFQNDALVRVDRREVVEGAARELVGRQAFDGE